MLQVDALIRYHFNLEPDNYDDDRWAELFGGIQWILKTQQNIKVN